MTFAPLPRTATPIGLDPLFAPPETDFWGSRPWHETVLAHALPGGAEPVAFVWDGRVAVTLLRSGGRLAAFTTPYTQDWRPLAAPGLGDGAWRAAGRAFAGALRRLPPVRLDTIEPDAAWLAPFLAGLRAGGIVAARFDHTARRTATVAPGEGWPAYLAARPSALRHTVERRLRAASAATRLVLHRSPGPALASAIASFRAVRAASWKPAEPFPEFDPALIAAAAEAGVLRLGILEDAADGTPIAAQYWILERGSGRALVPKLFHDEGRRASSPGTVLTALMVRHLIEEDRVRLLDFGRGDDPYKTAWAPERRPLIGLLLADPRHPAGAAALARHAAGALRRRLRERLGERLGEHLRGRLRGRLWGRLWGRA